MSEEAASTSQSSQTSALAEALRARFGEDIKLREARGELTLTIAAAQLSGTLRALRDAPEFSFAQMMDLCGVDYSGYKSGRPGLFVADALRDSEFHAPGAGAVFSDDDFSDSKPSAESQTEVNTDSQNADSQSPPNQNDSPRFAVVYHLLSLRHNRRLRVRAFCEDDSLPAVQSVCEIWPAANWFEREAFDLYGIFFHGHPDLRRILTDYGFIGHPFRKDFPISGHVEMRYDPDTRRVIYQPVSIPPREVIPRIVREDNPALNNGDGKDDG